MKQKMLLALIFVPAYTLYSSDQNCCFGKKRAREQSGPDELNERGQFKRTRTEKKAHDTVIKQIQTFIKHAESITIEVSLTGDIGGVSQEIYFDEPNRLRTYMHRLSTLTKEQVQEHENFRVTLRKPNLELSFTGFKRGGFLHFCV